MNTLKLFIIVVLGMSYIAACSQSVNVSQNSQPVTTPPPANLKTEIVEMNNVSAGAEDLYTTNCMTCHRDSGKGGKLTVEGKSINSEDLTAPKIKAMSDEKLMGYVSNGIEDEGMPAFADKLSSDEIKSVIAHVRTLQK